MSNPAPHVFMTRTSVQLVALAVLVAVLGAWSCRNVIQAGGGGPAAPSPGGAPAAPEVAPPQGPAGPSAAPAPASAKDAARVVCSTAPGSTERAAALAAIEKYQPGTQPWNANQAAASPTACVDALRLAAVYVNLVSGVPAGTILGQALQETGHCKSDLAREAFNFHGMKSHVSVSAFTYWKGDKFRKSSTESKTGEGEHQVSDFMKFAHADHGFLSLAERLLIPSLPYVKCFPQRADTAAFMACIGKHWAVHTNYSDVVLGLRAAYKLAACELRKDEWKLRGKWVGK